MKTQGYYILERERLWKYYKKMNLFSGKFHLVYPGIQEIVKTIPLKILQ